MSLKTRTTRTLLGLLAALGLVGALTMPALAADPYTVPLHEDHKGADSTDFQEDEDCGDYTTGVVWHFILNQYEGDDTAHLVAIFETAGQLEADATKVVGVQHFYVNTPTDDVLEDAWAEVDEEPGSANLVLSHVCHTGNEATPTPTPSESEGEATPTPTPSESEGEATPTGTPRESVAGGNPTPAPSGGDLPDTAMGSFGQVPATVLSLVLLGALAAMVYARLARQR